MDPVVSKTHKGCRRQTSVPHVWVSFSLGEGVTSTCPSDLTWSSSPDGSPTGLGRDFLGQVMLCTSGLIMSFKRTVKRSFTSWFD